LFFKQSKYKSDKLTDAEMIALSKKHHKHFGLIYECYFDVIFRFVFKRLGGDEENASDITQQTFIKAMIALPKYEERGYALSTWLYRIAQNEVNQFFRQQTKNHSVAIEEHHILSIITEIELDDFTENKQEQIISLLNKLNPEHLDLIELRFFQQLSFKEIAAIYGISEANAKMKIYRILEKMKEKAMCTS
jgi:RNA polymerase sigma-70 factor, ECF subfamily